MAAAEEAERAEALRAESAEAALAVARREMEAARRRAAELGEMEARYWHDFNDFQLQLRAHVDERDVLLRKVPMLPWWPHSRGQYQIFGGHWEFHQDMHIFTIDTDWGPI
jgi:hypothetical protein